MPLKVTWKKGMRLTADVFDAMDACNGENLRLAILAESGGRYGLFPSSRPFELSVNIGNNVLEVVSLSCRGITRSGRLVDIDFDSNYTCTFDTRVAIPSGNTDEEYLLVVKLHDKEFREVGSMHSECVYSFELLGANSPVDADSLVVGCLVNQYGWRLNETDFVPPCLFVDAHPKFAEQLEKAKGMFKSVSDRCLGAHGCVARFLLNSVWTAAFAEYTSLDKERGCITPGRLLSAVHKLVGAFVAGCSVDECVTLENEAPFVEYMRMPYAACSIYRDIAKGLGLCAEISVKMESVCAMTEARQTVAEPPKPKSRPEPEPKAPVRNRWEGLEI